MNDATETSFPEQNEHTPADRRNALVIVFLVVFIDLLGFGIVLPLLPLYTTDLLVPLMPSESMRPWRGVVLGLLMASFSFMQFLCSPIWGRLSDRVGRRPVLLIGLTASVSFYALFGIASEIGAQGHHALALALLFVSRLGAGIAGATISTAQAVIADSTPPENRAHGMALIGAAFGIGFTFGPLLGFASLFVPRAGAPGFAAATFSLVALILALRLLPETLRTQGSAARKRWLDWQNLLVTLKTPSVGLLVMIFFLATWSFGSLESTLALVNKVILNPDADLHVELTKEAARSTERYNFLIFAYVGMVLMLIQGFVYRRFVRRLGEIRFLRAGIVLLWLGFTSAVSVLLVRQSLADSGWLIPSALAAMTVAVVGFAFITPSVHALISNRSDPARQGEVLGVNQSAAALARILGPMCGPALFFVGNSHIWPFVFGALMITVVFFLALRVQPATAH
ncbi:MAG: tetracycline resistance MFS efflux pump [Gemmatales bacterium]|nr:MAG: tetracycline resistance MFS efflux pump [Gemmatales bacterium]